MPIRGFAFSTIVAALTCTVAASEVGAQALRLPGFGVPTTPTVSHGVVAGLPNVEPAPIGKRASTKTTTGVVVGLPDEEPLPVLARLALASNGWKPCCEPPSPTKGLWAGYPPESQMPSWQECWRLLRDALGWVCCRPVCSCGAPPSDASAWDWLTQWTPRLNSFSLTAITSSAWDWLSQWLPHLGSGTSSSTWDWLTQWLPFFGSDATSDSAESKWDWLTQWLPHFGSDATTEPAESKWDRLTQWLPRFGSNATTDPAESRWDRLTQWLPRFGAGQ